MPTQEEREQRNAAVRERYASMSESEREKILERSRAWKAARAEKDPDAHLQARKAQIERQELRMKTDPDYAERRRAYQRKQKRDKRAALKKAAAEGK